MGVNRPTSSAWDSNSGDRAPIATVTKNYRRAQSKQPIWWHEDICAEANLHVDIGGRAYFLSADGLLMPHQERPVTAGSALFHADPEVTGSVGPVSFRANDRVK